MLTEKKILSLEDIEAQTALAIPDRELLHVSDGGTSSTAGKPLYAFAFGCSGGHADGVILGLDIPICPAIAIGAQIAANKIPLTIVA